MNSRELGRLFLFSLLFAFIGISAMPTPAAPIFDYAWRGYDTGIFGEAFAPVNFVAGDIDNDGDLDLIVANSHFFRPAMTVLKNNGDKTFAPPVHYPLATNQNLGGVALSDVDGDGDLDALGSVRGSFDDGTLVKLWMNNGNGTFAQPVQFTTGQGPTEMIIADMNGDGHADVVTANYGGKSVSVLRHNGQQGFLPPVTVATGLGNDKIAAADVNGDGKIDIAVGGFDFNSSTWKHAILLGDGQGGLGAPTLYDPAPGARIGTSAVALRDLDNDGDADLMGGGLFSAGSVDAGAVTIRRNNGSGAFGPATIIQFPNFTETPKDINTADLNNDGFADIIAAVPSGRAVEGFVTLLSNGSGGYLAPMYVEASQQTFDTVAFDIDHDGDNDVMTLANSSAAVTVHENQGNGTFPSLTRYEVATSSDAVESADIDNDGDIDVVVNGEVDIASNDAVVKILKNNGNATFAPAQDYSPPRNFADMKLRDINGDGFVDLIFAPDGNYPNYHIGTALNNGNGTFAPTNVIQIFACGEGTIDAADMDGDGDLDIIMTEEESCQGGTSNRIFLLRNNGVGTFTVLPPIGLAALGLPHGLELADLTGDGRLDIVSVLSVGMTVFPGNGDMTFGAPIVSSSVAPFRFKLGDFNRDGKLDVGMIMQQSSFGTDTIGTSLGNGDGTFQAPRTQTGSSVLENLRISNDIEVADFNRDGILDITTMNYASNDASFFAGNADGSLQPHQRYGVGNTPNLATTADFNADGKPDIAVAIGLPPSGIHNAIVVLKNIAAGGPGQTPTPTPSVSPTPPTSPKPTPTPPASPTPTPVVTPSPTPTPSGPTLFDYDGDGRADVSVFRPSQSLWYMMRSRDGFSATSWGLSTDKITPADYDGDGKTDIAVFRPSDGSWYVLQSSTGTLFATNFGLSADIPTPADFDKDGRADISIYRPSTGTWWIMRSSGGLLSASFGTSQDIPVARDYDGDRRAELAVFRPSTGTWYYSNDFINPAQHFVAVQWGTPTDRVTPADYDGDDKTDIAVFRPSNGVWYIRNSSTGSLTAVAFGVASDIPVAADYDGDGRADIAVYRPSTGTWWINRTTTGVTAIAFGTSEDRPTPAAPNP